MIKLSSVVDCDQKLTRTIVWSSQTSNNVLLAVTLEYVAPAVLKEKQAEEQTRVISANQLNPMSDQKQITDRMIEFWCQILTERVKKITLPGGGPVTLGAFASLLSLSSAKVKSLGGLETVVDLDTTDQTPLSDEDRKAGGFGPEVQSKGQAAAQSVLYLLKVHPGFRDFVAHTIQDVSYFQDTDWAALAKN